MALPLGEAPRLAGHHIVNHFIRPALRKGSQRRIPDILTHAVVKLSEIPVWHFVLFKGPCGPSWLRVIRIVAHIRSRNHQRNIYANFRSSLIRHWIAVDIAIVCTSGTALSHTGNRTGDNTYPISDRGIIVPAEYIGITESTILHPTVVTSRDSALRYTANGQCIADSRYDKSIRQPGNISSTVSNSRSGRVLKPQLGSCVHVNLPVICARR